MGLESKEVLEQARASRQSDRHGGEIYFTGCGSEADNWVVFGTADALKHKGNHIITTRSNIMRCFLL